MGYYGGLMLKKDLTILSNPATKLGDAIGDGVQQELTPTLGKASPDAFVVYGKDAVETESGDGVVMLFEGEARSAEDLTGDGFDEATQSADEAEETTAPDYVVYGDDAAEQAKTHDEAEGEQPEAPDSFVFNWTDADEGDARAEMAEIGVYAKKAAPSAWEADVHIEAESFDDVFVDAAPALSFDGF